MQQLMHGKKKRRGNEGVIWRGNRKKTRKTRGDEVDGRGGGMRKKGRQSAERMTERRKKKWRGSDSKVERRRNV